MNYCSLSYSAAAVITNEDGVDDVPYLDKFTVGRKSQVLIYHWKCVGEKWSHQSARSVILKRGMATSLVDIPKSCRKCLHKNNPQLKENCGIVLEYICNVAAFKILE